MQYFGHGRPLYGSLPCYTMMGPDTRWYTNRDAEYVVLPPGSLKPNGMHNNLPFDRNWGRSHVLPYRVFGIANYVDDPYTPDIPLAVYRPTDYVPLSHSVVDEQPIRPYHHLY